MRLGVILYLPHNHGMYMTCTLYILGLLFKNSNNNIALKRQKQETAAWKIEHDQARTKKQEHTR